MSSLTTSQQQDVAEAGDIRLQAHQGAKGHPGTWLIHHKTQQQAAAQQSPVTTYQQQDVVEAGVTLQHGCHSSQQTSNRLYQKPGSPCSKIVTHENIPAAGPNHPSTWLSPIKTNQHQDVAEAHDAGLQAHKRPARVILQQSCHP